MDIHKICKHCGKKSNRGNICGYCAVKRRRVRIKIASVMYLGGKCSICGYDKNPWVLEFHHKDGDKKEFGISASSHNKSWERIKKELDKCELLCSNCHQEHHSKDRDGFIDSVSKSYSSNDEVSKLFYEFYKTWEEKRSEVLVK